ncbi:MAG: tetratricopeptide repeat protein [Actinomycetota bacterium]|nr:tetratricopeptide repeat protein [Actinomycetota bacterium]
MSPAADDARAQLDAGQFARARETATAGLTSAPDDAELLRLAGLAGLELEADDAVDQLRRVTELRPDDAEAWHELGEALATEGRSEEAADAFRRALELDPDDEVAMTHLGHTAFQTGAGNEGVKLLERAAGRFSGNSTAAISLVEMYRSLGQPDEALAQAVRVAEADPGDRMYALDVAELSLETGKLDDAAAAFGRLREIVDSEEEEVCALHGMILVELERGDSARALELAREALAIDAVGRTTGVVAHLEVETGSDPTAGEPRDASAAHIAGQGVPPSRQEVEEALRGSLRVLRRSSAEDRGYLGEEGLG